MESVAGIDGTAELPRYHSKTAGDRLRRPTPPDPAGPAFGLRKAAIYATCFVDYNAPDDRRRRPSACWPSRASRRGLAYPECCGMPQLEAGDIAEVAERAERVAAALLPLIDAGL